MQLGTVEGKVNTSNFEFRAVEEVKKFDFVSIKSNDNWILCQVDEVTKHPDGETIAKANIIGYREKGLTKAPRTVIEPDSIVYQADQELISDTLGLDDEGLRIGTLETNPEIDIHVNADDFYKHFAVLAQTGAGKCVTPETPILMSDGGLKEIREIFEQSDTVLKEDEEEELRLLEGCSLKAIDDNYSTTNADALYAYRKKADKVLEIETSSGRRIEVTPEHPLMVAEKNHEFAESREIEEGQHIAVPRNTTSQVEDDLPISKDLEQQANQESARRKNASENYQKYRELEDKGLSIGRIAERLEIPKSTVEKWRYQGYQPDKDAGLALSMNSKGITVPDNFSSDFTEFLALVISEGAEQQEKGSYRIIFTNNDDGLMQRFTDLANDLFGLEARSMRENAKYVDSTSLKHLLEDIGYNTLQRSRNKEIPQNVLKAGKASKKRFMKTFFDAEGCMEDHEITLVSASEQVINALTYMLIEFGIVARLSSREKEATNSDHSGEIYYRLSISGVDQMQKFSESIGFGIERKQDKLEKYLEGREGNTNTDIVPIDGDYLKAERNKLGLSQRKLSEQIGSHSTLVSLYERGERRPSRKKFSDMAETLDSQKFSSLADSDVYWDEVVSIEEKDYSGYVYDITVREHHNFIAGTGGIISHNSYLTGVIIEELLEEDFPVLVIDPHGEYHSLRSPNPDSDNPESYPVTEYSPNTDINSDAIPLKFSSLNMDKKELTTLIPDSLTNSQMGVLYNALKRLKEKNDEDYSLIDIEDAVTQEDSTAKWNLLNYLEQLEETNLFSKDPIDLENLVNPGEASIINLKAVEPDASEMTVYMLAQKLFNMRKENKIPPFIMIIEEAHNYVPEKGFGQALSNPIMRKIASEGRKFGVGIGVISQRPARIDKNVLSQANTQFILRVTNPNDLKAISKSFEGITSEIEDMITSLPPGVAFALGNEYPVMTDVRTRKSLHGGETQTNESYTPQEDIEVFKPEEDIDEVRSKTGEDYEEAYYPIYWVETDSMIKLVDGVNGKVKAERDKLSGKHEKVFQHLKQGRAKQEIVDELDIGISRIASIIDELENRDFIDSSQQPDESIIDHEKVERGVDEDSLIDLEVEKGELDEGEMAEVKLVRYPYFSKRDEVYDPILQKHL